MSSDQNVQSSKSNQILKVIFVGPSGVGKTSIVNSYIYKDFKVNMNPTISASFSSVDIKRDDNTLLTLQIWDTAGQERYFSVSKLFFRDAAVACVCFEVGSMESISSIPFWTNTVLQESPKCQLIFVGTKSDLITSDQLKTVDELIHDIASNEGAKYYIFSSAKTKHNINDIFRSVISLAPQFTKETFYSISETVNHDSKKKCC